MENNKTWVWVLAVIIIVGGVIYFTRNTSTQPTTTPTTQPTGTQQNAKVTNVEFANHIQAKLPEQDVFVESSKDDSKVVRVESGDIEKNADLVKKTVYATADAVAHDPFKLGQNPLGPFAKGKSFGFTLQDWLAANGKGTYTVSDNTAKLDLSFQKLVANGTYTVWCSRLTFPPNPKIVDRPCGAADGSQNTFKADASGNGAFQLSLTPLELSTKETASVVAVAYHSDDKTYAADPGKFGFTTHVQLFFLLPVEQQ